jgi:hypothetical protein
VAVVVDGHVVPAAVARTIDLLDGAPVEVTGLHLRDPDRRRSRWDGATLVDRWERAVFRPGPDATAPVDLRRSRPGRRLSGWPAAECGTDVVLDLTSDGLPAGEAAVTPLGLWSLRYGRGRRRLGAGAFVPEYLAGDDAGVCELVAEDSAGQRVLYRSVSAVDRLSPARTRNQAAWKAAEFPARALTTLAAHTPATPGAEPQPVVPPGRASTAAAAAVTGRVLARTVREAVRRVRSRPTWLVAVRVGAGLRPGRSGFGTQGFTALEAPEGRFFADPFVVHDDDGAHVFVEDGPVDGGPARISVVRLDEKGRQQGVPRVVLDRPTHLSYPFVFRDNGTWYLLPETAGTGTVELWRAREFPHDWERCAVLLDGVRAWDPTVLRHHGRYWLFATMAAPGVRPSDELCLFSAPDLLGPWEPHPMNPVVSDVGRARPAGRVLETGDGLLRPAQDGSGAYGRRIVLNRIDVLTAEEYAETPVGSIEPGWLPGVVRTHTYTCDGPFEVLDGVTYEPRSWRRRAQGRPRAR